MSPLIKRMRTGRKGCMKDRRDWYRPEVGGQRVAHVWRNRRKARL